MQRRDACEESKQHERLVELRPHVIGTLPAPVDGRVRADYVVERQHMVVAELVRAPAVGPHGADVWPDLGLWKDHADLHAVPDMGSPTEATAGEPRALSPEVSSGQGLEQGAGTGARPVAAHTR